MFVCLTCNVAIKITCAIFFFTDNHYLSLPFNNLEKIPDVSFFYGNQFNFYSIFFDIL